MKVLHVLFELQFSGAELMLQTASSKFAASGLEITVLATGPVEGIYAEYFRKLNWTVLHIPFQKNLSFFKKLHSFIKESKFDVVHIHTEGAFIYKAIIAYLAGTKRIISTVHNNFVFSGYLKYRRQLHHIIALKLLRVKFISISESVEHTEKTMYFTDTTLIHNWIDVDIFSKAPVHSSPVSNQTIETSRAIKMISVGKCLHEKQHFKILELVKELVNRGVKCHYTHIGCGPLENKEKAWVNNNNLLEHVTFISHTNEVALHLSQSNYYLMPSLFEGVGNACLEAMASGLLCIVTNAPGLSTLITDNVTGVIANFDDIPQVADSLIDIHLNKSKFAYMVKNAQSYVLGKHSVANAEQMIQLYY
jgi:glycosyltransferase involved in cell wall biosynthesis